MNGMCRSNAIIYQNETIFEIYCNDKTESHHSSIEAPSTSHLRWCSEVVPEVIVCAGATGSCITGSCITGNDITGSREPEMKGRYFPAFFRYFPRFLFYPYFLLVFPELL
jgi:hypothetical protein